MAHEMKISATIVWLFLIQIGNANTNVMAQDSAEHGVKVGKTFIDCNDYLSNKTSKQAYIMGVIDGLSAGLLIKNEDDFNWLRSCVVGKASNQIAAIVDLYLKNHPEEWHYYMNVLVYKSLISNCPKNE